jgi:hypothetical protein
VDCTLGCINRPRTADTAARRASPCSGRACMLDKGSCQRLPFRLIWRAGKACRAETDVVVRLPKKLMPLVLWALIARGSSRSCLVVAFSAVGTVLAVSRRRVCRLEVSLQALDARSWSASTLSGARSIHELGVARR